MNVPQIVSLVKFATDDVPRSVDFGLAAIAVWLPDSSVSAQAVRRPSSASESADGADHGTGFLYQASAAGQTGALEPAWGATLGADTPDGSLSWQAVAPGTQNPLTAATWTLIAPPDNALTVASETIAGLVASAILEGGTSGETYTVDCIGTLQSGASRTVRHIVTVI